MRVTRIDVRGARGQSPRRSSDGTASPPTGGAPERRAELTRDGGNVIASVWVEGLSACSAQAGEVHSHIVGASQRDNLYEMARRVQHALDGHVGTNGDVVDRSAVADYWQAIQRLAD